MAALQRACPLEFQFLCPTDGAVTHRPLPFWTTHGIIPEAHIAVCDFLKHICSTDISCIPALSPAFTQLHPSRRRSLQPALSTHLHADALTCPG